MKKIFLIASVGTLLLASCTKSYTCDCYDDDDEEIISTTDYPETSNENAKIFKEQCEKKECTWVTN